jgi:hypothetical protein
MKRKSAIITAFIILTTSQQAFAAYFCVRRTGIPNECFYDDPQQCQREALRSSGECITNPDAPIAIEFTGAQQFCAVSGTAGTCVYPDRGSCNAEAARTNGACVPNVPEATPPEDPFKPQRPY